eukprot:gene28144-34840_t
MVAHADLVVHDNDFVLTCRSKALTGKFVVEREVHRRKSGTSSCGMKQVQLPLARALGTALVLAHVTLRRLQNDEDIKRQLRLAAEADWELPGGRTFRWHVDAFMVMLSGHLSAPGWPKRAVLWNLVLLQEAEGDWYPSDDLATALQAGTPVHTGCAARPRCSAAAILESMPTGLVAELGGRKVLAERAWASLLAVAKYNRLPETWCSNPQAEPPAAKRDLCDSTTEWLNQLGSEHADFQVSRSSHENTLVARFYLILIICVIAMPVKILMTVLFTSGGAVVVPSHWGIRKLPNPTPMTATGVLQVGFNEPFSRAERILMMATMWVVMLTLNVSFYYSKAIQCCSLEWICLPEPIAFGEPGADTANDPDGAVATGSSAGSRQGPQAVRAKVEDGWDVEVSQAHASQCVEQWAKKLQAQSEMSSRLWTDCQEDAKGTRSPAATSRRPGDLKQRAASVKQHVVQVVGLIHSNHSLLALTK